MQLNYHTYFATCQNVTLKAYVKRDFRGSGLIRKVLHCYPKLEKDFVINIMP